jgi:O-antigen/teichoic acid export membrane protein
VASLGIPDYLTRRVASLPDRASAECVSGIVLLTGIATVASAGLWVVVSALALPIAASFVLPVALAGMVVGMGSHVLASFLVGGQRLGRFAWWRAVSIAFGTTAALGSLVAGGGLFGFMVAELVAALLMLALGWYASRIRFDLSGLEPATIRRIVIGGLPFLGWNLALAIRNGIDVILTGVLLRDQVAGWLSAAYRIVYIPIFIPTIIVTPLLPALTRHRDDAEVFYRTARKSLLIVLAMTMPISAAFVVLAPEVPALLGWGAEFRHSVPVIAILALEQPLMATDMVLGTMLIALHRERSWLLVAVVAGAFNIGMNAVALPLFERELGNGAIGAAVVEGSTELLMFVGAIALLPRGSIDREAGSLAGRILLAASADLAVGILLRPVSLWIGLAAGGIVFVALAFGLRALEVDDFRSLAAAVGTRLRRR